MSYTIYEFRVIYVVASARLPSRQETKNLGVILLLHPWCVSFRFMLYLSLLVFSLLLLKWCFFSLVLSNPHGSHAGSSSNTTTEDAYHQCGANFCVMNVNNNDNLQRPADNEIFEISTIYLACIFFAVIMIALLVDPLSR